jgi:hypothetical protein
MFVLDIFLREWEHRETTSGKLIWAIFQLIWEKPGSSTAVRYLKACVKGTVYTRMNASGNAFATQGLIARGEG